MATPASPAAPAVLPPLYARWMESFLGKAIPPEPQATCDDCAMCAPAGTSSPQSAEYFSPRVKCCTYEPNLANYLVGGALGDTASPISAGRATLERRIESGIGVTPLALYSSRAFDVVYDQSSAAFGRADALLCPHYLDVEGGRCGIWQNRNSVCSTWFCKHDRGAVGLRFWDEMRGLLRTIERTVSAWCVLESDLDPAALDAVFADRSSRLRKLPLTAGDLDRLADPEARRTLWGNRAGREKEFYRECARRVEALDWDDVARVGGTDVAIAARSVRTAFSKLTDMGIPAHLVFGPIRIVSVDAENMRTISYSELNPIDLSAELWPLLPSFDGRPTSEVRRDLEKNHRIRLDDDLVRKLSDFQILVPPKPPQ